jgi:hypothetical protein
MTIIAWDGATLAGDSMCTVDGLRLFGMAKLHRLADGSICGVTGTRSCTTRIIAWLERNAGLGGMPDEGWTSETPGTKGGTVLRVCPNGEVWLYDPDGAMQHPPGLIAMGSGRDYALGAMAAGKTAAEAVAIATRFDAHCGGDTTTLTLEAAP